MKLRGHSLFSRACSLPQVRAPAMAARRALALVLALAGAERARAALARGAARPVLTARHAAHCAARRASALRACDSGVGDSCPLPSDEEEEEEEELTFLGQRFSGSPLVLAQDLALNALPVVLPIAAFDGYDEARAGRDALGPGLGWASSPPHANPKPKPQSGPNRHPGPTRCSAR